MIYYDKKAHNVNDCGLKQQEALQAISLCSKRPPAQIKAPLIRAVLFATQVYKPGSVLTAIYLDPQLLTGSSHLLGTVGQTYCPTHGVAPDRVYSTPMFPWGGWSLTPPFHYDRLAPATSLCCTCPEVTLGGRYPLSLPCGARTFLIWNLSVSIRGCPTRSRVYCILRKAKCQIPLQILLERDIL